MFYVLGGGSGFATLIGLVRWFMMVRKKAKELKVSRNVLSISDVG